MCKFQLILRFVLATVFIIPTAEAVLKFITKPSDPTYVNNGSTAKLVWDYRDPNNELQGIVFSVLVGIRFKGMLVKQQGVVKNHSQLLAAYQGRVRIEGKATLVIERISPEDNTFFRCEILGNRDKESVVRLIVADQEECKCSCHDVIYVSIIGVLVFVIFVLLIYVLWLHKKGTGGRHRVYEDEGDYENDMELKDLELSCRSSDNFAQHPAEYMDIKETSLDDTQTQTQAADQVADYAPLHPSTHSWEVSRDQVTVEKIIGRGAFGQVAKGTATDLRGRPGRTTIAIKMLKDDASESDSRDLVNELETMKQLKPHPHVIKLVGCVTETEPLLVLIEYVPFGDLLGYLRKSRGLNDTYFKDPDIKPRTNLTSLQLMKFAWEVTDGMSYLSSKSIIHRDLAARNVLVGENETCKVTDFGMAREVQQENVYEKKTKGRLPVKWTAYEALLYGIYTTKSDVWSYGVLLYEIFTIGGSPYPRMDGKKIAKLLQQDYRMPKPQHVDDELYQIMMRCWQNDPDVRPTFTELRNQLKDMEAKHKGLINMKMYDKQLYANVEDLNI